MEKVDGGYRITGQTAWNSGSVHAEWFTFAGLSFDEGSAPRPLWFLVPREDVEVLDTWFISGMSGTGSNDVAVESVFVPQYRTGPFDLALAGSAPGMLIHDNPMYHLPFLPFAMAEVTPVVVGAMRGAADAFVDRTRARQGTLSQEKKPPESRAPRYGSVVHLPPPTPRKPSSTRSSNASPRTARNDLILATAAK